jgi:hypothetical protein
MKTPADVHELSSREQAENPPHQSYPDELQARCVRPDGGIKWGGSQVFVGEAFAGEVVGLEQVEDDLWPVHLGPLRVGILHGRSRTIVPLEQGVSHVPGHDEA